MATMSMKIKDAIKLLEIYEDGEQEIMIVWKRKTKEDKFLKQEIKKQASDWPTDY